MSETPRFNISETARQRGKAEARRWASSRWGITLLAGAFAIAGGLVGLLLASLGHPANVAKHVASDQWPATLAVITSVFAGAAAIWFVFFIVSLWKTDRAPLQQRDEARQRLELLKLASEQIEVTPVSTRCRLGVNGRFTILCEIQNSGRTAQFAVTIEAVDDSEQPLGDPYIHLEWWDRPNVIVEEIPAVEHREIVVGIATMEPGRFAFYSMSPNGTHRDPPCLAVLDHVTVWIRVSARNLTEKSYSRKIGIQISWPQGADEPTASLAPDPIDAELRLSTPSFSALLDF